MKCSLSIVPIILLASCATLAPAPELEVTVAHISAPQVQVFESRATVTIRIDNESAEPIAILGGVHHIRINGRRIGKAMDNSRTELPAFSSVTRELPLRLSNLGVIRSTRETIDRKEVAYRLDSRLSIETGSGHRKCSLQREGEVALDELVPTRPPNSGLIPTPLNP